MIIVNDSLYKSNTYLVVVKKSDHLLLLLTLNYHFIDKDIVACHIKVVTTVYNLLSIL